MLTFEEFQSLFPSQKGVTKQTFTEFLLRAEVVVQDIMVYTVDELTPEGKGVYKTALALQIGYTAVEGFTEGNLASQNVNGSQQSFALAGGGADALKVSPLTRAKLRAAKLCVR